MIDNSTITYDQEKYLAKKTLARSLINCVMLGVCEQDQMKEGAGLTAYMVRYARMNLPAATLTEGTAPSYSSFTLEQVTVTLDQWGDVVQISDVAQLTAKHPLIEEASKLMADNAARVMDREITNVMMAGTNVQYGDGSVSSRVTITSDMKASYPVLAKARVTMINNGAPAKGGPSGDARQVAAKGNFLMGNSYVAVCGPSVIADIQEPSANLGTWAAVSSYQNAKSIYQAEVGTAFGLRFVETNFIPVFVLLGNTTVAVTSGSDGGITGLVVTAVDGGGSLTSATTYYWKVTRQDKLRGFEETISIEHTTASAATANNESFTFALPSTAGYRYRVYFGSSTGDSNLKLANSSWAEPSATVTVTAVPSSTTTAPGHLRASLTDTAGNPSAIHPIFIIAESAVGWVGFYKTRMYVTAPGAEKYDPLAQFRTVGYKFFGKAVIRDNTRLLRVEVASSY